MGWGIAETDTKILNLTLQRRGGLSLKLNSSGSFFLPKQTKKQQQKRNLRNTSHLFWDCLPSHLLSMASPLLFGGWGASIAALSCAAYSILVCIAFSLSPHSDPCISASPSSCNCIMLLLDDKAF